MRTNTPDRPPVVLLQAPNPYRSSVFAAALAVAAMLGLAMLAVVTISDARAVTSITASNLDALSTGEQVGSAVGSTFQAPGSGDTTASLSSRVFFDPATNLYTYTYLLTPALDSVSSLATEFAATGFNGVAGYSFGHAVAAGGSGSAVDFGIVLNDDTDQTLTFNGAPFFGDGDPVRFFFQSSIAPGTGGNLALGTSSGPGGSAAAINPGATDGEPPVIPIPEPASITALAAGVIVLLSRRSPRAR